MKLKAEHIMSFEVVGNDDELPTVENPSYVYKKGDTLFVLFDAMDPDKVAQKYTVVDIRQEVLSYLEYGEQHIIVYLEPIKDDIAQTDQPH